MASRLETNSVQIREFQERDSVSIAEIYSDYVLHSTVTFETEPPNPQEILRQKSTITSRNLPYLVLEIDGHVRGYAYASPYRSRPAYSHTVEHSVYLSSKFTGKGLGELLLRQLILDCKKRGLAQMIAVIGDSENVASMKLHEKLGFRKVGTLHNVGYKHNKWLDTTIYQLPLK